MKCGTLVMVGSCLSWTLSSRGFVLLSDTTIGSMDPSPEPRDFAARIDMGYLNTVHCGRGFIPARLGYFTRHLLLPSAYANIDGPPCNNIFSGMYCVLDLSCYGTGLNSMPWAHVGHVFDILSPGPHTLEFHDSLQDKYGSVSKVKGILGKTYTSQIPDFCMRFWLRKSIVCFFIRNPSMRLQNLECDIWSGLIRHYRSSPQSTKKRSLTMTPTVVGITDHDALIKDINGSETKEIDMLLWCSKAALDLVGRGESEYSRAIKSCNPAITQAMPFLPIFSLVYRFVPTSLQRKLAEWVPIQLVRKLKNIVDIQDAKSILMQKRKALNEPGASNNARDIMSLLLKANSEADQRDQLPENQILGQMNTLMLAGHETTSGALSLVLQLLSLNIPLQERLREELQKAPSILSYEELSSLPYLDAVCKEVLRLYPPAPFMERVALKDWVVPLRYPLKGKDGNTITDIKVKKGTSIYVSFRGDDVFSWAKVVHWIQVLSFRAHRSDLHPAQSELNGFRALQWFHTLKEQTTVSQMERSHVCR
ncbi:cytochrome P450 domain-containing protein [Rhizoctonia solani AG-1 IA]|uniref:Cytochrome P450 domain-containing protein n=1 Tax=Thanatephorus cucumeris (strain AG1-IA) TaxID=983506 RepID=L8X832_THACA|nr:cytochrome P450 domain-containing protein [Rhizoctonia solani AG-1 IA]